MAGNHSRAERLGAFALMVAAVSFWPPIGILLGAIAAVWGTNTRKRSGPILAVLGVFGAAASAFVSIQFTAIGRQNAVWLTHYTEHFWRDYEEIIIDLTEELLDQLIFGVELHHSAAGRLREPHSTFPE